MNLDKFIHICELIKKSQEDLIAARKLNIELGEFSEGYWKIINDFGISLYGELLWESILDFIHGHWDGKIYGGTNHKLIIKIDNFTQLWEYLESLKNKNGQIVLFA